MGIARGGRPPDVRVSALAASKPYLGGRSTLCALAIRHLKHQRNKGLECAGSSISRTAVSLALLYLALRGIKFTAIQSA
jgi:hypothetical protein